MKKWTGLILSVLILGAARLPAQAADSPLVLGLLEIRGLDSLAASAFELSKAAGSPTPKEMISIVLYGALGTMPGMGIPAEGTVRAVLFDNGSDQGGWAILLPVANEGADYLSGLGQNGWKNESETADGLLHYVAPDGASVAWKEVYFLTRGATLIAAQTADDARRADAAKPLLPPILPVEGDVAIQIRPAALVEAFAPQIAEQLDQTFKNPDLPASSAAMGDLYVKAYLAAAKQVEECDLGLGVADGNLNVHTRVAAVAGTALAQWLETVKPAAAAAAVVALPDALGVETLNLGDLSLLAPAYFQFLERLMSAMPSGLEPAALARYMENEKAGYAQLAGDVGLALLPPTKELPLRVAEYVALKDPAVLRARMPEMIQGNNDVMKGMARDASQPMPFQIEISLGEPREYRGIAVDKMAYAFQLDEKMAAIWPKAFPTKLDIELAWVPGGLIASTAGSATTDALVDRALDGTATPVAALPAWQALYPEPEANLADVSHLALFDAVRAYLALGDALNGGNQADFVPASSGNLEGSSYIMEGLMSRLRFSLADVSAIGEKIKEVQAKAMADMQQQMEAQGVTSMEEDSAIESSDDMESDESDAGSAEEDIQAPAPAVDVPEEAAPAPAE